MGRECKQKGEELVAVLGILAAAAEGGGGGMRWEDGREGAEPWQFEVGEEGGGLPGGEELGQTCLDSQMLRTCPKGLHNCRTVPLHLHGV